MASILIKKVLDAVRPNRTAPIIAVQNDYNSRTISAVITVDGKPVAIPATASAAISLRRRDGEGKIFAGTVNTDGTVSVTIPQWALELEGDVTYSLKLVGEDFSLSTPHGLISVQYAPADGEISEDNADYDSYTRLLAEMSSLRGEVETLTLFTRYSAYADGTDYADVWSDGLDYIGIAVGRSAPSDKSGYAWSRMTGETPERGVDYWTEADRAEIVAETATKTDAYADEKISASENKQRTYGAQTYCNALKGSASGAILGIDDISPLPHELTVSCRSDTVTDLSSFKLYAQGANLLKFPQWAGTGNSTDRDYHFSERYAVVSGLASGDGSNSYSAGWWMPWCKKTQGITNKMLKGHTYTIAYDLEVLEKLADFEFPVSSGVVFSYDGTSKFVYRYDITGLGKYHVHFSLKLEASNEIIAVALNSCRMKISDFIVLEGEYTEETMPTYEAYIEPVEYAVEADGTVSGVNAIYPFTTLMTDAGAAVEISCTYNRDINKALTELREAIISLGGNV